MLSPRFGESNDCAGFSLRPDGVEILARMLTRGFTLGYFPILPTGRAALNALLFPHLELPPRNPKPFPRIQFMCMLIVGDVLLTGFQTDFREERRTKPWALPLGALSMVTVVCLVLLALLAVVQVAHMHPLDSDADHCPLCIAMHTAAPVAVTAAVVVMVQIECAPRSSRRARSCATGTPSSTHGPLQPVASTVTVWICNFPDPKSGTWGTHIITIDISQSHGHGNRASSNLIFSLISSARRTI